MLALETGYQHRFWRSYWTSFLPGAFAGYAWNPGGFTRGVFCDECKSVHVGGVDAGGVYVGPSLKMALALGRGMSTVGLRSEFFLTGDMVNRTLLGFEFGTQ